MYPTPIVAYRVLYLYYTLPYCSVLCSVVFYGTHYRTVVQNLPQYGVVRYGTHHSIARCRTEPTRVWDPPQYIAVQNRTNQSVGPTTVVQYRSNHSVVRYGTHHSAVLESITSHIPITLWRSTHHNAVQNPQQYGAEPPSVV